MFINFKKILFIFLIFTFLFNSLPSYARYRDRKNIQATLDEIPESTSGSTDEEGGITFSFEEGKTECVLSTELLPLRQIFQVILGQIKLGEVPTSVDRVRITFPNGSVDFNTEGINNGGLIGFSLQGAPENTADGTFLLSSAHYEIKKEDIVKAFLGQVLKSNDVNLSFVIQLMEGEKVKLGMKFVIRDIPIAVKAKLLKIFKRSLEDGSICYLLDGIFEVTLPDLEVYGEQEFFDQLINEGLVNPLLGTILPFTITLSDSKVSKITCVFRKCKLKKMAAETYSSFLDFNQCVSNPAGESSITVSDGVVTCVDPNDNVIEVRK